MSRRRLKKGAPAGAHTTLFKTCKHAKIHERTYLTRHGSAAAQALTQARTIAALLPRSFTCNAALAGIYSIGAVRHQRRHMEAGGMQASRNGRERLADDDKINTRLVSWSDATAREAAVHVLCVMSGRPELILARKQHGQPVT